MKRAKMILYCVRGHSVSDNAGRLRVRPSTVLDWRRRFGPEGVTGLADLPRPGKPRRMGRLSHEGAGGVGSPTTEATSRLGRSSGGSTSHDLRAGGLPVRRKEGVCLGGERRWCVCTDPDSLPRPSISWIC